MKWAWLGLVLAGCVTTPTPISTHPDAGTAVMPPVADRQGAVRAVVQSFVLATEAGRFDEVLSLLAKPLRDRYTKENLERDFGADPLASARLSQIKLKSSGPFVEAKDSASLEWSAGRSLRLVYEPEGWRIAALE